MWGCGVHIPHLTTLHISLLTVLHTSHTSHSTPDPSTVPFPLPLQSPKRLRKQEDTSSPWHTCPTPLHLVEGMSLRPSSDHMGWKLFFNLSFMACAELLGTAISYTLCHMILWRCFDLYTWRYCYYSIPHMHANWSYYFIKLLWKFNSKKCLKLLELSSNLQLSVFMAPGQLYLLYCVVHYNSSASETNCMIIFFVL